MQRQGEKERGPYRAGSRGTWGRSRRRRSTAGTGSRSPALRSCGVVLSWYVVCQIASRCTLDCVCVSVYVCVSPSSLKTHCPREPAVVEAEEAPVVAAGGAACCIRRKERRRVRQIKKGASHHDGANQSATGADKRTRAGLDVVAAVVAVVRRVLPAVGAALGRPRQHVLRRLRVYLMRRAGRCIQR